MGAAFLGGSFCLERASAWSAGVAVLHFFTWLPSPAMCSRTLVALAAHDETHQGAAFGVWMFGFFHHPPWNDRDPSPTPCARRTRRPKGLSM